MEKLKAIIVDIDGTIADCEHRRHLVSDGNKQWDLFFEKMILDPVNQWCKLIIESVRLRNVCMTDDLVTVLFVSGRPEKYRAITRQWMDTNFVLPLSISEDRLFMRQDGDYRDDSLVKEEIYLERIKPQYNVVFAIDDRKKVVDMWRKNGITCLHCADGEF